DPPNEQAHLELMRRYAAQGDPRAALRQYERLERALHRELGLAPGAEALALRDVLLTGPTSPPSPTATTTIVGRHKQMRQLEQIVEQARHGRGQTAFLSGPGGVGKSFLAQRLRAEAAAKGWRTGAGMASKIEGDWPYAPVL